MVVTVSELPVLGATDQRILGSLMEKQATVPASYPLTANALRSACNQASSREPVVDFDQQTVEQTARELKDRGLLRIVWADTGRRTLKYHQTLTERLALEPDEQALLTVLLLRGAQAAGELRTRTERLHGFADRGEVEACLLRMAARPEPLVRELERGPRQQDPRWIHLLGPVPHSVPSVRTLSDDVLARAGEDWLTAAEVMDLVRTSGLKDPDDVRDLALGLVVRLVAAGQLVPGELDASTHRPWPGSSAEAVARIVEHWPGEVLSFKATSPQVGD